MSTKNSWNNNVLDANVTFNGGTMSIGTDSTSNVINIGTAGARTVTMGSITGAAALAIQYGTGDFTLASATGTVISALDTGEITNPLQPAFLATHSVAQNNVTGAGATPTVNFTTEVFDQNGDYDGTNTFTAPVTGKYAFYCNVYVTDIPAGADTNTYISIITSNASYLSNTWAWDTASTGSTISGSFSGLFDMDLGDTAQIGIRLDGGAGDTADIPAFTTRTIFGGYLAC